MSNSIRFFTALMIFSIGCAPTRNMADSIQGTYYGYLPCVNCPGIHYELRLNPDFTYSEITQYEGMEDQIISEHSYKLTRDSVIILRGKKREEGVNRFVFSGDNLAILSMSGAKTGSSFPERYILTKEKPVAAKKFEPLTKTGFKATGNEPFWGLEIEFGNIFRFTSLTEEFPELIFPFSNPARPGDMSLIHYSASTTDTEMEITISREECMDTMKGDLFPYAVTVSVSQSLTGNSALMRGCGRYMGNYSINDKWILEKIDGKPIDLPASRPPPALEIDLAGKVIYGYGGCNRFQGRVELSNNILITGSILSTKMACLDTGDMETLFLKTLSGNELEFEISEGTLVLKDGETELHFIRAE